METEAADFDAVLADAQRLGFAEADPSMDIDGIDAAHKLAILSAIAFGVLLPENAISITGIRQITSTDIAAASAEQCVVRLVAQAERTVGGPRLRVAPVWVRAGSTLARANGPENFVALEGEPIGQLSFSGPGAGPGPTASAVAGDLIALANGARGTSFGRVSTTLTSSLAEPPDRPTQQGTDHAAQNEARFYIRHESSTAVEQALTAVDIDARALEMMMPASQHCFVAGPCTTEQLETALKSLPVAMVMRITEPANP